MKPIECGRRDMEGWGAITYEQAAEMLKAQELFNKIILSKGKYSRFNGYSEQKTLKTADGNEQTASVSSRFAVPGIAY